jgi:hypothetical protein
LQERVSDDVGIEVIAQVNKYLQQPGLRFETVKVFRLQPRHFAKIFTMRAMNLKLLLDTHRQRMKQAGLSVMHRRAGVVEHPFGTLKRWCGSVHFLVRGKDKVRSEMSLLTPWYNIRRVMTVLGMGKFHEG